METGINRWIILMLALLCAVQVASAAGFDVKSETIDPASGPLEPGQPVTACYVLTYEMATNDDGTDETFEFSTGLQDPVWDFKIYRDGVAIYTTKKTEFYPVLTEFEISYGDGKTELDVQLCGKVPTSTSGKVLVTKIEHLQKETVRDTHSVTRDVVTSAQVQGSLSAQQQRLKDLKANMDEKSAQGVDISAVQTEYNAASQALASAAAAGPAEAAGYISTATKALDKAEVLLDKAWAEKEVSNAGAAIETLDEMITYFVEERSMKSDAQVVAIITKRESAVQFYTQAQDSLNAANYSQARSKASDALSKANDALADANALKEKIGEGFNLGNLLGGNLLLYIGIGIVIILGIVGVVLYRRKTRWDELG